MNSTELKTRLSMTMGMHLGVFNNGDPAIWIEPPELPRQLVTTGILCKIKGIPGGTVSNSSSWQKHHDQIWDVVLVNYNRSTNLNSAIDLMRRAFEVRRCIHLEPKTDFYEQARFEIFDPVMIQAIRS